MHLNLLSIIIPLHLFLAQILCSVATTHSPVPYHPLDNIAVNCGSSGSSTGLDGRQWTGDIGSRYTSSLLGKTGKLISSKTTSQKHSPDPVPFLSARISRWPFAYTFRVSPGQKFIRLHFYPASYRGGFKRSKALFTVKAGSYTILSNFSASLTADASDLDSLVKEYCVNVEDEKPLIITFSPTEGGSSPQTYAFVNGIEIVSMPTGLYYTRQGDAGAHVVGQNIRFPIEKSIVLEMVHRFNVGGTTISSTEDTGVFRHWSDDSNSLLEKSNAQPLTTALRIKYTGISSYFAPQKVYQTSWSMALDRQKNNNFTWKLPIDLGFRYLLRLHFCDFEYEIEEGDRTKFSIFFDEHVAEAKADIIKWSGGNRVAVYKDYLVMMEGDRMEGKHELLVVYVPHNHESIEQSDTILKGLEVFKLSNHDRNLAGVNPVPLSCALTSSNAKLRKFVYASGGNALATVFVIFLTFTNISVYMLRVWAENFSKKNASPLPPEGLCRRFSLSEVLLVTNNFSHEFLIGSGGFGNVYKAHINDGTTIVAIKRLKSKSKQGAKEFKTEIEMLSKLRHTHLVSLIGYCDERHEMILVYDYMEHGTLADHLYKHYTCSNGSICHLTWEHRMKVCIGAARGLDYLHTGTRRSMIHRDVKTTNILLDKDWVAKISDFGLCKEGSTNHSHTHVSTDVKGTFGYLDPEYFITRRLTKKSDVYAFGVVLLEVLCGRPAVDSNLEEDQRSLAWWAQRCIGEAKHDQLIDPSLRGHISPECLKVFTEVANKCLHKHPSGRPTMSQVVVSLEWILASQEQPRHACNIDYDDKNTQENDILPQANSATGVIAGGVAAGAARWFAAPAIALAKWRRRKPRDHFLDVPGVNSKPVSTDGTHLSGSVSKGSSVTVPPTPRSESEILQSVDLKSFTFSDLKTVTRNFRPETMIGQGGFGSVFKGRIDEGSCMAAKPGTGVVVAVKRLNQDGFQGHKEWLAEVNYLGQFRHPHLVKLIGYCLEDEHRLLVYEFMPRASLEYHLFRTGGGSNFQPLSWSLRLKVALGAAKALAFLHTAETQVIHRDFKTSNILLDSDYNAKLSGFGLAKDGPTGDNSYVSTRVMGTYGYAAPEYIATGHLTTKSDVYGFGAVLLEMLSGRRAVDSNRPSGQQNLVEWAKPYLGNKRKLFHVLDTRLKGQYSLDTAHRAAKLAVRCLSNDPKFRPNMGEVVKELEQLQDSKETQSS